MTKQKEYSGDSGFTIVEVGIIVPVMMIFAIALFSILITYVQASGGAKVRLLQAYGLQDAMARIESDIKVGPGFSATVNTANTPDPSLTFNNNYPLANTPWDFNGNDATHRVLIINEFATTANPAASTRSPVYLRASGGALPCVISNDTNGLLTYTVIYFIGKDKVGSNKTTLYRRILPNPAGDSTTTACTLQYQKLSCPDAATMSPSTRDATCKADDEVIATHINQLSVAYYADGSATTALNTYGASPPDNVQTASSANVTIGMSQIAYGSTIANSMSLRTATLNTGILP